MDTDGLLLRVPLTKIVPLQHASDTVLCTQMDQRFSRHGAHPPAVELHQSLRRIENFKDLPLVRLGILQYFVFGERDAGLRLAGWIADHTGEIADQNNHIMSEFLNVFELVEQDRMAQMQIRSGRSEHDCHKQKPLPL